jgi:hypothetical protein
VIDSETQELLQEIVRRESRSVLTYVGEAFPWTNSRGGDGLARLQKILCEENRALEALGQFLTRRRMAVSFLGPYPTSFTTINFLSLEHLVPRLVAYQKSSIAQLERDLARLADPEAKAQVEKLLEVKRRQLPQLENLLTPHPEPAKA